QSPAAGRHRVERARQTPLLLFRRLAALSAPHQIEYASDTTEDGREASRAGSFRSTPTCWAHGQAHKGHMIEHSPDSLLPAPTTAASRSDSSRWTFALAFSEAGAQRI